MKRILVLVVLALALARVGAQSGCVPSSFFEAQTWLEDARGMGHAHIGGVLPLYRKVSNTITLPIELKYHHIFGYMRTLKIDGFYQGYPVTEYAASGEHIINFPTRLVNADTASYPDDGWKMVTFEAHTNDTDGVTPTRIARLRGSWDAVNGKVRSALNPFDLEAHAWFALPGGLKSPRGYSNAKMAARSVPTACVSGVWSPLVTAASSITGQTRNLRVAIDPDLHRLPIPFAGTTVLEVPGMVGRWQTVNVDTAKLTEGDHKLLIVSDDKGMFDVPVPGTLSGALVVGFTVTR